MRRTEWGRKEGSPAGTPQFSGVKETIFPSFDSRHSESVLSTTSKQKSFKALSKPAEKKSETLCEILRLRNSFEENLNKIRKNYLGKERNVFQLIQDEDELKVLIATRPRVLEIHSRVRAGEGRFIDDYRSGFLKNSGGSEGKIREKEEVRFEKKKGELVEDLEGLLKEKIEDSKKIVEEYWADKVGELEERLMELENEREWEDERNEELVEETRKEELREEIEKKVKKEYENYRKGKKGKNLTKKEKEGLIMKLQAELEIEQMQAMDNEKGKWEKEEVKKVKEMCKENIKQEHDQILKKKEKELKKQAETEISEVIKSLLKDTEEVVSQKINSLSSSNESFQSHLESLLKQESLTEFLSSLHQSYKSQILEKTIQLLNKDLKKPLSQRIDLEVKIRLEESIHSSLNEAFEDSHEAFRKRIEQEQTQKLIELEYQYEAKRSQDLEAAVAKKFSRTEKDLKVQYLKKLDKLKLDLRKEFEEIYIGQIKKIRALLIQEKSEAARIKSQINVYVNKTSEEKASEIRGLHHQEELLGRKIRDMSMRQQVELDQTEFKPTPEGSKSPLLRSNSAFSPLLQADSEVARTIPKPLPPPTFGAFEEIQKKSVSPERRLLKVYDTKEIANSLILKNYEEAHKQAWVTLKETEEPQKVKSTYAEITELLASGKTLYKRETPKKHSLYDELLRKKYGVIEPRVK